MNRASVFFVSCLVVSFLASVSVVQAGGFALYEWGNAAIGQGTAFYATGDDPSVVAYNPAQMTRLKGTQVYGGVVAITPMSDVYIDGSKHTTQTKSNLVPHGFITHQITDDLYFGFGTFTRFGLGTSYDDGWDAATLLKEAYLASHSFTPTFAYKLTDGLSVALGGEVIKGNFLLRREYPTFDSSTLKVDVDGTSLTGNLGVLYEFSDDFSIGFSYHAPTHFKAEGDVEVGGAVAGVNQSGDATLNADFPSSYTLGVGYSPIEKLTIEFDVMYTEWDHFDAIDFDFSGTNAFISDSSEPFYYKNTWRFQLGANYVLTDEWTLRAGYVYDQSPIKNSYASVMLPANDRQMFTLGAGWDIGSLTMDISGMYIIAKERLGMSMTDGAGTTYKVDFKGGQTFGAGLSLGYTF